MTKKKKEIEKEEAEEFVIEKDKTHYLNKEKRLNKEKVEDINNHCKDYFLEKFDSIKEGDIFKKEDND